jgi:hypothetical protein
MMPEKHKQAQHRAAASARFALTQLGFVAHHTCAFELGCLMSHNWLRTPDCQTVRYKMTKEKQ